MATPLLMPKLGLTMTEGVLASWHVKAGDRVAPGSVLYVVETDKIANEIEAQGSGTISEIVAEEGAVLEVGAVVGYWIDDTQAGASTLPDVSPQDRSSPDQVARHPQIPVAVPARIEQPPRAKAPVSSDEQPRIVATPLARRMARDGGIDIRQIAGTGPRGRVKAADVARAAANAEPVAVRHTAPPSVTAEARQARAVAARVTLAKQTIPHFYVRAEANVSPLLALRKQLNEDGTYPRLSVTHFLVAAMGRALAAVPEFDAVWTEDGVSSLGTTDVGIVVSTERGLIIPVARAAGLQPLDHVSRTADDVIERARRGALSGADIGRAAVSVSNVGSRRVSGLIPIIDVGQAAILGVGMPSPVFRPDENGQPVLRQELGLYLSCDHRVSDGLLAARFLETVTDLLERPMTLLRGPH